MSAPIPVNEPIITAEAKRYVQEALDSGWISSAGPAIEKFEQAFAHAVGARHAITVASGTAALHCALAALQIGPGDEVIVPDFTMIASPFAVLYTGATPVFVDVDPETYNMDPALLEAAVTPRTKAIMPVHIYGHSCDMDPILSLAKKRGIAVLEDAAEAHGALYRGRHCGSLGTISAFSFYGNKIITTGEGGMVCTDDDALAARVRSFKDLSHVPGHRFLHAEIGYNYRMTNLQAALGLGQLEHLKEFVETKQRMAALYHQRLSSIRGLRLPVTKDYAFNVFWMYAVLVEDAFGMTRDQLTEALKARGIDTRMFFLPCHSQPVFAQPSLKLRPGRPRQSRLTVAGKASVGRPAIAQRFPTQGTFPVTEDVSRRGFYLPSGLALTEEQIDTVCSTIRSIAHV